MSKFDRLSVIDGTLTIVTGADETHASSLFQLLDSIKLNETQAEVRVYDLGLSHQSMKKLKHYENQIEKLRIETFDFDSYPPYFNIRIAAGEYAWKPVIFAAELRRLSTRFLVWLDSGNVLDSKLQNVRRAIARSGLWSPESAGTILDWTDRQLVHRVGLSVSQQNRSNLNGAIVGVDSDSEAAVHVARLWSLGAQSREWIAPQGSSRTNHRQDQALLSCLVAASGIRPFPHRTLEIRTHQDIQ